MNRLDYTIPDNEYWWGGIVSAGWRMPFDSHSEEMFDPCAGRENDQFAPVFVSLFHDFYEGMLFRNIAKILMVFLLYLLILAKYQNKDTRDAV